MKIAHLETFAKVAATGSFTRAAHDLFTTQPTVTNHIQTLEQELGYQLLIRQKNKVRLTENGKNIYHKVEEIFRLMDSIKNANARSDTLAGVLNIAASSVMGADVLPPVLQKVFSDYPNVNIQLKFGNSHSIASWVDEGVVDMGFAPASSGFPRLNFTPLLREPCVLATSAGNYEDYRNRLEHGVCRGNDFVIREKGTELYEVSINYIKRLPFYSENKPPHILWNMESIKNFVIEGAGIAILPRCCIKKCLRLDLLRILPAGTPVGSITYCMIERKNQSYNKLFSSFRNILLEQEYAPSGPFFPNK